MTKHSALIIIDMQNEFCLNEDGRVKECYDAIIPNINKQAQLFREQSIPIIWLNWSIDFEKDLSLMSSSQRKLFNNFTYPASMMWKESLNSNKRVLEAGSWSSSILKDLEVAPQDIHIHKQRISGFWFTDLDKELKRQNIEKLFFAGINTDQCVLSTIMDAHCLGYDCELIKSCTASSSPQYCFDAAVYNIQSI